MGNNTAGLFDGVVPFVHVAEQLSFRRAAEALGVTTAAVSRAVQRLEGELGVKLLERSTRTVRLTAEGARFFARCKEAVAQMRLGRDEMAEARRAPHGTLTVSASPIVGRLVVPRLARFTLLHPALSVQLRFTDRLVRFAEDDIDVALRVGAAKDEAVVARALLRPRWVTVASPAYLARRGTPRRADDLGGHDCIRFVHPRNGPQPWTFADPKRGTTFAISPAGPLDVDLGEMLIDAAMAGVGLCQVLDFMARDHLREGRLVEVLRDLAAQGPPIFAVYPSTRRTLPRIRVFVDFLTAELRAP